jgi:hypothetical protein
MQLIPTLISQTVKQMEHGRPGFFQPVPPVAKQYFQRNLITILGSMAEGFGPPFTNRERRNHGETMSHPAQWSHSTLGRMLRS